MAKNETQTQSGRCPTHGMVHATREVPKVKFPYIVYGVMRAVASAKPYRCPECGSKVAKS